MDFAWEAILAASTVFFLGAISPGPSLLMVIRNTIVGGRRRGVMCAVGHGIGFGLYAGCLLYTSPSPRDVEESRMPSSA